MYFPEYCDKCVAVAIAPLLMLVMRDVHRPRGSSCPTPVDAKATDSDGAG